MASKALRIYLAGLAALILAGCSTFVSDEQDIAALPTLTPSPYASPTLAVGILPTATPATPTMTPTITLTPATSPTPLFAVIPTLSPQQQTAGPDSASGNLLKPTIIYFKAFPPETEPVAPGDSVTLFWSTTGATAAAVTRMNGDGSRGKSWAVNVPDGYLQITAEGSERTEQYTLTVTNGITTVEKTVQVTVACKLAWFFSSASVLGCPQSNPEMMDATLQEFERGRMVLLAQANQIIVLFNDAQVSGTSNRPAWLIMTNPWSEGQPENDPAIQPPEGLGQPQRGFGLIWRTTPGVSDRLGWAVGGEVSFGTMIQRSTGENGGLYFSDPNGAVIGLLPNAKGWLALGVTVPPTTTPTPGS